MSLELKLSLLLVVTAIAPLGACKKGSGKSNAQPAASASAASGSGAAAAPAAASLTVDELLTKLVPTVCNTVEQCKNDKLKAVVTTTATMVAGFGAMGKPKLQKQLDSVDATMKKDNRWIPDKQECQTLGGVALEVLGLTPGALKAKIGKTVKYDGKKAAACLEEVSSLPECRTEVKLAQEPKLGEIDKFNKEMGKRMEADTKACNEMLTGMVKLGGACEEGYECKGEHTRCVMDHAKNKKVCTAGGPAR